ncbi:unnamed protein product [Caenorhabditis auriculariae]|uniref:Serpentine receptor class gamma n=1 Tax=Caenorhabditis auriculariae TaxID=2777116 RepID=A0A8S1GTN3_9PELO|nr:unnamed protein product [Caenorhabditis auriculariae]
MVVNLKDFQPLFNKLQEISTFLLYISNRIVQPLFEILNKKKTALITITFDGNIWRKYYWLVALSGLVYSSAISLTYLLNGVDTTYEIVDGKLIIESHHMDIIALMNPVFACIYFTMIFSSGLATFCIVGKRLEVLHPMRKVLSTRKMAIITIVNSVVISGNLLYTTLYGVMTALNINALNFLSIRLMLFSSDMITLAMPWILLFLDKNVGKMLGFSKSIKTNNVQTIT